MITYIKINGFKSFQDFEMNFTPLTVIAGSNAAGKSNLFDALRLLSSLADSDKIQKSFREQRGDLTELFTRYDETTIANEMSFAVEMLVNPVITDTWGVTESLKYTRLRYELTLQRFINSSNLEDIRVIHEKLDTIKHESDKWIKILPQETANIWRPKVISGRRQMPYMYTAEHNGIPTVLVPQDGSQGKKRHYPLNNVTRTIISGFDSVDFKHILAAKEEMKNWKFLQLNPEVLRLPTSKTTGEDIIDSEGRNLAAALFRIKQINPYYLKEISRKLHSFLPNFINVDVEDDVENKQYVIKVQDVNGKKYSSRVLSEGTLRILTLCILLYDDNYKGLLCFEEPENGINPFRIKATTSLLHDLSIDFTYPDALLRQVIVNTHSTVFVANIYDMWPNKYVTIAYAEMVNRISNINDSRKKLLVTKITPLEQEQRDAFQTSIQFSDQERKLTYACLMNYMKMHDNETTKE